MDITGKLHRIEATEEKGNDFKVREFILDISTIEQGTMRKFENYAKFQTTQSRTQLLDGLQVGDNVRVSYGINGRFYQDKNFEERFAQNNNAFKIEKI